MQDWGIHGDLEVFKEGAHRSCEIVCMAVMWIPLHGADVPFALTGDLAVTFGRHIQVNNVEETAATRYIHTKSLHHHVGLAETTLNLYSAYNPGGKKRSI